MRLRRLYSAAVGFVCLPATIVALVGLPPPPPRAHAPTALLWKTSAVAVDPFISNLRHWSVASIFAATLFTASVPNVGASEVGVEVEAPTFSTGETVEICTKRGPLGACLRTELRSETNENDVSKKYFRDPSDLIKQKEAVMRAESDSGNALIQKLKQQSVDNQEKNELYVQRKTFENSQTGAFGPFDRQVLIMNTDGRTYSLLENPVAMRLKSAGFINGERQFITQPTQEDLDAAVSPESSSFLGGLFGGS